MYIAIRHIRHVMTDATCATRASSRLTGLVVIVDLERVLDRHVGDRKPAVEPELDARALRRFKLSTNQNTPR